MLTQRVIDELRLALPPVFAGTSLNQLTGGAIHWPTIQNRRSAREIPDECFVRSGPRVLVIRDPFLDWWRETLKEARQPPPRNGPPRRRMQRRRAGSTGAAARCAPDGPPRGGPSSRPG
jgi:hypothetical protein